MSEIVLCIPVNIFGLNREIVHQFMEIVESVNFPTVHETKPDGILWAKVGASHAHETRRIDSDVAFFVDVHALIWTLAHAFVAVYALLLVD